VVLWLEKKAEFPRISAIVTSYETDVPKKYVVSGNDVLLSCELPSHVADLLRVTAWLDSEGHELGSLGNLASWTWLSGRWPLTSLRLSAMPCYLISTIVSCGCDLGWGGGGYGAVISSSKVEVLHARLPELPDLNPHTMMTGNAAEPCSSSSSLSSTR
jgi:hypothetical protein